MKKMMISFLFFPLVFSSFSYSYAAQTLNQGERALEERPFNPKPLKCNDPVTGSDGLEPETDQTNNQ